MNNKIIITDFDGTVTLSDTVSSFLDKFADKKWLDIEQEWQNGRISSKTCLSRQFELIPHISMSEISDFLNTIKIDNSFIKLCNLASDKGLKVVIVSDGFDLFINHVLKKYAVTDLKVFSNHLELIDGRFKMSFPNKNTQCRIGAGSCKCAVVEHYRNLYEHIFYVGDGGSDFCVCEKVDILFAKNALSAYCKSKNIDFIEFNTFDEVIKNDRLGLIV